MDDLRPPCPSCQNPVSIHAADCPYCGRSQVSIALRVDVVLPDRRNLGTEDRYAIIRIGATGEDILAAAAIPLPDGVPVNVGRNVPDPIGAAMDRADDLFLDVSQQHISITVDGLDVIVVDISKNGTFVNGQPMPKEQRVRYRMPVLMRLASACNVWIARTS